MPRFHAALAFDRGASRFPGALHFENAIDDLGELKSASFEADSFGAKLEHRPVDGKNECTLFVDASRIHERGDAPLAFAWATLVAMKLQDAVTWRNARLDELFPSRFRPASNAAGSSLPQAVRADARSRGHS